MGKEFTKLIQSRSVVNHQFSPEDAAKLMRGIKRMNPRTLEDQKYMNFKDLTVSEDLFMYEMLFGDTQKTDRIWSARQTGFLAAEYARLILHFGKVFTEPNPGQVRYQGSLIGVGSGLILSNACLETLKVTAAIVAKRMLNEKILTARDQMRILFSVASIVAFRDVPRGSMHVFRADKVEDISITIADVPYTRNAITGGNTQADASMVSRNAWLRTAWSVFVQIAYTREKTRDMPKEEYTSQEERSRLTDGQITRSGCIAVADALAKRIHSREIMTIITETRGKNRLSYAAAVRQYISMYSAIVMGVVCDVMHEAMRKTELAGEPVRSSLVQDGESGLFYHSLSFRDPEKCVWWWPLWRGSVDRSRATREDALTTVPSIRVYSEDARHAHSFRGSRTASTSMPIRHWRPHDAQDTAATSNKESNLGMDVVLLTREIGTVQALSRDQNVDDETLEATIEKLRPLADKVALGISSSERMVRKIQRTASTPDFHSRAMAEASLEKWPGDDKWTQERPRDPRTGYVPIRKSPDGGIDVIRQSSDSRKNQRSACVELDTLRSDSRVAKAALRSAEQILRCYYEEARSDGEESGFRTPVFTSAEPVGSSSVYNAREGLDTSTVPAVSSSAASSSSARDTYASVSYPAVDKDEFETPPGSTSTVRDEDPYAAASSSSAIAYSARRKNVP
jgi:hypothetical protein